MSEDNIVKIYSGQEVNALFIKGELEEQGIGSFIKNDFQSGITAGFGTGVPNVVDLFVQETDLEKAQPFVDEFLNNLNKQ